MSDGDSIDFLVDRLLHCAVGHGNDEAFIRDYFQHELRQWARMNATETYTGLEAIVQPLCAYVRDPARIAMVLDELRNRLCDKFGVPRPPPPQGISWNPPAPTTRKK